MRVVPKKPLIEQIIDAETEILKANREVDYIELTEAEHQEILDSCFPRINFGPPYIVKRGRIFTQLTEEKPERLTQLMGYPVRIIKG